MSDNSPRREQAEVDAGVEPLQVEYVGSGAPTLRGLVPELALNAVLPFICFRVLLAFDVTTVYALVWSSVFPLAGLTLGWIRARSLDPIALVALLFIVSSTVVGLVTREARLNLLVDAVQPAVSGSAFLVSLAAARPLTFYFGRQFASGGVPSRMRLYEANWEDEVFRHGHRVTTTVWGIVLVAEAAVFMLLVLNLDPEIVGGVLSLTGWGVFIGLVVWTRLYVAYLERIASLEEDESKTKAEG
jgi:hypothetical protein